MENFLQSLDESVFTPELKSKIQELFESQLSSIKEEYTQKIAELESKATEYGTSIAEEYAEKADAYSVYVQDLYESKYSKSLDAFLDKVVEEYVEENKIVVENRVKEAQLSALLEGFDSMLSTGAVYISNISEAGTKAEKELAEAKEALSKAIKEAAELKKEKAEMIKESLIKEAKMDLTLVEAEKFDKLSKVVGFNADKVDSFKETLTSIKESVVGAVAAPINEDNNENQPAWSRFL